MNIDTYFYLYNVDPQCFVIVWAYLGFIRYSGEDEKLKFVSGTSVIFSVFEFLVVEVIVSRSTVAVFRLPL